MHPSGDKKQSYGRGQLKNHRVKRFGFYWGQKRVTKIIGKARDILSDTKVVVNLTIAAAIIYVIGCITATGYAGINYPPGFEWKTVKMTVTAYCPCSKCCGSSADGITANGHKIADGDTFVAADKKFPFGTEMVIDGYNDNYSVPVLDRGGAIKGNHIDLFFPSHQQALNWGVRSIDVKIRTR